MNRLVSNVLAVCSVLLYTSGYSISEYFYADNMDGWTFLRNTLKGVVYLFLVLLNFLPRTVLAKSSMIVFAFICFGDLVDRLVFDISEFVNSDYAMILVALIAGVIAYKYNVKRISERSTYENDNPISGNGNNRYGS